jgi:hypothetical protein
LPVGLSVPWGECCQRWHAIKFRRLRSPECDKL